MTQTTEQTHSHEASACYRGARNTAIVGAVFSAIFVLLLVVNLIGTAVLGPSRENTLAEELKPDSPLRVFVDGLLKGADRLTEIVDVMLDVSRLDVGAVTLSRTPVKINDVIQLAAGEWTSALEERGHTLDVEGFETLPTLDGDKERLQQAFSQLINNAIKYTPDGGHIQVTGEVHGESNGLFMEVTVSDNGIGIAPDDQHKIFDKFYRTGDLMKHSTGKTKFKGAGPGLGLSLVKGIVDAHSGRIWVDSPGHDEEACPGSSFHVVLPLHPPEPEYNPGKAETATHRADAIGLRQASSE